MARKSCSTQTCAMLLLLICLVAHRGSASHIRSPSFFRRSLLADPPAPPPTTSLTYRAADAPASLSGLQDAPSTGTVTVGHYLTNSGLFASTSYAAGTQNGGQKAHSSSSTTGTWGQEISYSAVNVNGDSRTDILEDSTVLHGGVTIDSVKFHQQNVVWTLDTKAKVAYKIDSSSSGSGTGSVIGVFKTGPVDEGGHPMLVSVDSLGDAWVGNLNIVGSTVGSVVKIKNVCSGPHSTGSTTYGSWASGPTSGDACVVQYTALTDNTLTITALALDGGDNLWFLASNSFTGDASTNFLNVYKVAKDASTATLMYGPLVIGSGSFGTPGGMSAVVDKYGYLWTGSGSFLYGGAGTYSVLRFDTSINTPNDAAKPILPFKMPNEANMLNLDSDSNLWVAGNAYVTKVFTDAARIQAASPSTVLSATLGGTSIGITLSVSAISAPISLDLSVDASLAAACVDKSDGCCTGGYFDGGIAITRDVAASGASFVPSNLNTIYVANICDTGIVFPITNAAGTGIPTLGAVIPTGSNIQSIAADRTSNIWVVGITITDFDMTTNVFVIEKGDTTVNEVTGLTYASGFNLLSGMGDLTGYITAQPTAIATYTYLHDTAITGYSKWDGGAIGWAFTAFGTTNGSSSGSPMYTVTAQAGDNLATLQDLSTLSYTPVLDAAIAAGGLGSGRYLRVDVQLSRTGKVAPLIGPQGHGQVPTLTELRVLAFDHDPSAKCQSVYVSATDDSTANGGAGGTYANVVAGMCTQGPPITIDNGSFDSDTQEADALITTGTTTGTIIAYKSVNYINALPTWILETSYSPSQLTVSDYHGKQASCSATVAVWDDSPPMYIAPGGSDIKLKADSPTAPALCAWPPNIKYWCLLDIFSQSNGRFIQTAILPVRDNCAAVSGFAMTVDSLRTTNGATPSTASGAGFGCSDTDPRSQLGDCTLTADGGKYNFCVKAQRRTVFTNLDRVYTMQFLVQDAGTQQGVNAGTLFTRSLRVPPIWSFFPANVCSRPSYPSPANTISG